MKFENYIELLKEYKIKYGDLKIQKKYITTNNINLGRWVDTNRQLYKKNKLSKDKIDLLNDIGFFWGSNQLDWMIYYNSLKEYKNVYGNLEIPKNYITTNGIKLGTWISTQRNLYKNNKLIQDRVELLNNIDFIWIVNELEWIDYYYLLEEYKKTYGDLIVPVRYKTKNGIKLGNWISTQRQLYKNGKLSQEKIDLLNSVNFIWIVDEFEWIDYYDLLKEYSDIYGNLKILSNYITHDGIKLGSWISTQRQLYKNGKLSQEKIDLLNSINFIWIVNELEWIDYYDLLKEYKNIYGNLKIPTNYITDDGIKLGNWISNQRQSYKNGKLSQEKIDLLNSINFIWIVNELEWIDYYDLLKEYKNIYGNLKIPTNYITKNNIKLGNWVSFQRQLYKNEKLSQNKINLLNSINFVWKSNNSNIISFNETCVFYYIHKYFNDTIQSDRIILNGKELDIYTPSLNIAIEYDGEAWHTKNSIKKDLYKNKICNKNDIQLIRIREPNCPKLKNVQNVYILDEINNKSLELVIKNILKNYYGLHKININIDKDILNILNLYNEKNNPNNNWNINYEIAKEYFNINGNLFIPRRYKTENGINIGNWIQIQRNKYKSKNQTLSNEKIKLLEKIGMIWDLNEYKWFEYFKYCKEYKKMYGNLNIATNFRTENGFYLGIWVRKQIKLHNDNKLEKNKFMLFKEIGLILK